MLQEQQDSLKAKAKSFMILLTGVQTARSNMLKKSGITGNDFPAQGRTEGKIPVWSNRPAEIQNAIQAEQDSINFREQRFSKILEEEGFSNLCDFQQESRILIQMENEQKRMAKQISSYEQRIQDYSNRYQELCKYLPKDSILSKNSGLKEKNGYRNIRKGNLSYKAEYRTYPYGNFFPYCP